MSFLNKLTAFLPLAKKNEQPESFFALELGAETLTAAFWVIEGRELKILGTASENYSSNDEIITVVDKLLDQVLGLKEIEPQKILFGVPHSWLVDENLKDEYLKLLRDLVKELELVPMAYVATSNALVHFLEKIEGIPPTAILVGFDKHHLTVTVTRAGKLDGVKVVQRGEAAGSDIEKALLGFTDVETLPSKILLYGDQVTELKSQLLSFPWMSKLSFLHFPKIEVLDENIEIKSICLAGASEIQSDIVYKDEMVPVTVDSAVKPEVEEKDTHPEADEPKTEESAQEHNFGFMVGDVAEEVQSSKFKIQNYENEEESDNKLISKEERNLEIQDFQEEGETLAAPAVEEKEQKVRVLFKRFIPKTFVNRTILAGIVAILVLLLGAYLLLIRAEVKIFVEPRILERDTEVTADPNQKTVNEDSKIIPGQAIDTEISGSSKAQATGKKQVGDPAKGTVSIINNTTNGQSFSKGTILTSASGVNFKLDNTASVSATPIEAEAKSKITVTVTAIDLGADGNIPSETTLTVSNYPTSQFVAKAQGNFSGGTSKEVTVVSSEDQNRLLASLASELRKQAQQKLQEKLPNKKILEEGLLEEIIRKGYSKNINDQASEFSLNLTARYKGTAFEEKDLKLIVSKLVTTQVPDGFILDLSETETQADVSKLEKDGKLIFLARFRAKLMPKLDTEKIKDQIKFKTPNEVVSILKSMENILGSEIQMKPNLPPFLQRLPILSRNIKVEVGLK